MNRGVGRIVTPSSLGRVMAARSRVPFCHQYTHELIGHGHGHPPPAATDHTIRPNCPIPSSSSAAIQVSGSAVRRDNRGSVPDPFCDEVRRPSIPASSPNHHLSKPPAPERVSCLAPGII